MIFKSKYSFEQGPIRPPNEANSLLVRVTRNCPWNKCLFCPVYKGEKFSRRSVEEIMDDLAAMESAHKKVREVSEEQGFGGIINRQVTAYIQANYPELFSIAYWQYHGGENVFLQDGDSLLLPVDDLVKVLKTIKDKFPSVKRITTYSRSRTILRRTLNELIKLKESGLKRIHVGLESGNDRVLEYMEKGVTGDQHIEAGKLLKSAGLSLSEYVILGLGGEKLWKEHALDTANVLNSINPDFIRVRTLAVPKSSPLYKKVARGEFILLNDDQVVREEALFIENLNNIESRFFSDHILNLLEEVCGNFPEDKNLMLAIINRYLSLGDEMRDIFKLGRRTGYFRRLGDLENSSLAVPVKQLYNQLQKENMSVDNYIQQLMLRFI